MDQNEINKDKWNKSSKPYIFYEFILWCTVDYIGATGGFCHDIGHNKRHLRCLPGVWLVFSKNVSLLKN